MPANRLLTKGRGDRANHQRIRVLGPLSSPSGFEKAPCVRIIVLAGGRIGPQTSRANISVLDAGQAIEAIDRARTDIVSRTPDLGGSLGIREPGKRVAPALAPATACLRSGAPHTSALKWFHSKQTTR